MLIDMLQERRRSASIRLYGLECAAVTPPPADGYLAELQEIADLTRAALGADGAAVNLLVDDVQVTVVSTGPVVEPVGRDLSICSIVLRDHEHDQIVEVPDMREVDELAHLPFVDGRCGALRFYAAAPLHGKHGLALGTLCAWGEQSQRLDAVRRATLKQFGRAAVAVLDERRRALVPTPGGVLRPPLSRQA